MTNQFLTIQPDGLSQEALLAPRMWAIDFPVTASRAVLQAREHGSCLVRSDDQNVARHLGHSIQSVVELHGTPAFFINCDVDHLSLSAVNSAVEQMKRFAEVHKRRRGLIVLGNLDPFAVPYSDRRESAERTEAQAIAAKAITNLLVGEDGPQVCAITTIKEDAPLFEHFEVIAGIDESTFVPENLLRCNYSVKIAQVQSVPGRALDM